MINIKHKEDCCGCFACKQICPQQCIEVIHDNQGFSYPAIDATKCIDCHLCEKSCPVLNQYAIKEGPLNCYLSYSKNDDIRITSSSGGVFTELSKLIISKGGVIFGAMFDDNWQVYYSETSSIEGLQAFRGSKYVQSDIRNSYNRVKEYLNEGRYVLFSGTPCYVAGLKHFLKKEYENLLTVDFVCHSIPSPKVWYLYLESLKKKYNSEISGLSFRNKNNGWSQYSIAVDFKNRKGVTHGFTESHFSNLFMRGFASDIYTRPSCSRCPARNFSSGSDITLADAWDVNKYHPEKNDEKGLSHVMINTDKGRHFYSSLENSDMIDTQTISYLEVEPFSMHLPLTSSCSPSKTRQFFYFALNSGVNVLSLIKISLCADSFIRKFSSIKKRLYKNGK